MDPMKGLPNTARSRPGSSGEKTFRQPVLSLATDPAEGGQAIDDEMAKIAREELKPFRKELKSEEDKPKVGKFRPPDSDRRRELKSNQGRRRSATISTMLSGTAITLLRTFQGVVVGDGKPKINPLPVAKDVWRVFRPDFLLP